MTQDVRMRGFAKRSSVSEVLRTIEARVGPLGPTRVPFQAARGRVLAEDVVATRNIPPHRRSAMDGYAVRAEDTPGKLDVLGELMAAEQFEGTLGRGQAMRLMTGAKVPDGATAVVMVEDTKLDDDRVEVEKELAEGKNIFRVGEDLEAGRTVLTKGRRLLPQDIAMLITAGAYEVTVQRRPRVRIIPCGSELVPAGTPPTGSQIVESNAYLLEGLARRDGADPMLHPIVADDPQALHRAIAEPGADLVVITGGSSVGKEDFAPVVVREHGELWVHGIKVKPASPTGIGKIGDTVVALAPGYPVATFVAWDMFVRPIVQQMTGLPVRWPYAKVEAQLTQPINKRPGRIELVRVTFNESTQGPALATPIPGGAALLSTLTRADGFLYLPENAGPYDVGAPVAGYRFA